MLGLMESGDKGEFHLTHWPGASVPIPPVFKPDVWLLDDHVLLFGRAAGRDLDALGEQLPSGLAGWDLADVPDELYLRRFLHMDASDAEQVRAFCADYGPVGDPDDEMRDFPWGALREGRVMLGDFETGAEAPMPKVGFEDTAKAPLRQTLARLFAGDMEWFEAVFSERGMSPTPLALYGAQTITQVAAYQAVLRYMLKMWVALSGQKDIEAVVGLQSRRSAVPMLDGAGVWLGQQGGAFLAKFFDPALTPFHVHLDAGFPRPLSELPNVYQAMCLQLANHIAEEAPFRPCEECGTIFARKQDRRYTMGQRRLTGGRFCSDTCEDRFHQRRHRQKKREERGAKP